MVDRVWFKPKDGLQVPLGRLDPGQMFPPEGASVVRDEYIERRLHDGSGTIVDVEGDEARIAGLSVRDESDGKDTAPESNRVESDARDADTPPMRSIRQRKT